MRITIAYLLKIASNAKARALVWTGQPMIAIIAYK